MKRFYKQKQIGKLYFSLCYSPYLPILDIKLYFVDKKFSEFRLCILLIQFEINDSDFYPF